MNNLPDSLVRFGAQLEDAIRRHPELHDDDRPAPGHERRNRRLGRIAAVLAAAAVTALVVVNLPSSQDPASAVERAEAVLAAADDTILHVVVIETQTSPDGRADTARSESWQRLTPPYDQREIVFDSAGNTRAEVAWANGVLQQYDPRTNTITESQPDPQGAPKPSPSRMEFFRDQMLGLLRSGQAQADGPTVVDGRDVVRITSKAENMAMVVDAHTHEPQEWRIGQEGRVLSVRFEAYDRLPVNDATLRLLSISANHPGATVTR